MAYEVGKEYTFGKKEFVASRETGRLLFNIGERSEGSVYRVKSYRCQEKNLPEKLVCIYDGNGYFHQTLTSVLPQIYEVGKVYEFKVLRTCMGDMTLRDDVNDISHFNIKIYDSKIKRFDTVKCKIEKIDSEGIGLTYISLNKAVSDASYTESDILELPFIKDKPWSRGVRRVVNSGPFTEALQVSGTKGLDWLCRGAESVLRFVPQWLKTAPMRRICWLERMQECITMILETPSFAKPLAASDNDGLSLRERLSLVVDQLDHYIDAAKLVAEKKAEELIVRTLENIRGNGWIYRPKERMQVMICVLNIEPGLQYEHIPEIFSIIKNRHAESDFFELFGLSFLSVLRTYIENQREHINPSDRPSLRRLIEALAIELLWSQEKNIELKDYDRHRGLLYILANLLTDKVNPDMVGAALRSFVGLNENPVEFGWKALSDINYLCYHLLPSAVTLPSLQQSAIFEGEEVRVKISGKNINVSPAWSDVELKNVLKRNICAGIAFSFNHVSRLQSKAADNDIALTNHRLLWDEVDRCIGEHPKAAVSQMISPSVGVGSIVRFVVDGQAQPAKPVFDCTLIDEDMKAVLELDFYFPLNYGKMSDLFLDSEGRRLILEGVVTKINADGIPKISITSDVRDKNYVDAGKDWHDGTDVVAKITDTKGTQYKALSDFGYSLLISKKSGQYAVDDTLIVRVNNVNLKDRGEKLYVNADVISVADPEEYGKACELNMKDFGNYVFRELMSGIAVGEEEPDSNIQEDAAEPDIESLEPVVIGSESISDVSLLFEMCAHLQRKNLVEGYNDLAVAKLMSDFAGDRLRSDSIRLNMRLQEQISLFAKNGVLDIIKVEERLAECRNVSYLTPDVRSKKEIVAMLAGLDNPAFMARTVTADGPYWDRTLSALHSLVTSYNLLDGLSAEDIRLGIRKKIQMLLSLPETKIDYNRLPVVEDTEHEFKTTIIYPAGGMQPDERTQGEIIARSIAGFLNTSGGTLYIGVDNAGYVKGLEEDFKYLNHGSSEYDLREIEDKFQLLIHDSLRLHIGSTVDGQPLFPDYISIDFEEMENSIVLCRISVNRFKGVVPFKNGRLFIRKPGETAEIFTASEKKKFIEQRKAAL